MIKVFFNLIVMFFVSVNIFAVNNPAVFLVNLYHEPVDVRLIMNNESVFSVNALQGFSSTYIVNIARTGSAILRYKVSSDDQYIIYSDQNGETPLNCVLSNGKFHAIVIGVNGEPAFHTLNRGEDGVSPVIAAVNGTESMLKRVEIGRNWNRTPAATLVNVQTDGITNFTAFNKGDYGLFWQFAWQFNDGGKFYNYQDDSGSNIEYFNFIENNCYLFIAYYLEGDTDCGILFNITPPAE